MLTEGVTRWQKMFHEAITPNHIQLYGPITNNQKIWKGRILKRKEKVKLDKEKQEYLKIQQW